MTPPEITYILQHSGAKVLLIDHQFVGLIDEFLKSSSEAKKLKVIVSHDTGRQGCPYEEFLARGRAVSQEKGWMGLPFEADEQAPATLCYT